MTVNPTDETRAAQALRTLALFAGTAPTDLAQLATTSHLFRFRRGARLLLDDPRDACLVLLSGRAKRCVPRGAAGELTLETFEAGEVLDAGCWCCGAKPQVGRLVATEGGAALRLRRASLEGLLERDPVLTLRLLRATSLRLAAALDAMSRNACLPIVDRLYRFFVEVAPTRGSDTTSGLLIQHGLAQHELASCIGASRELVNRHLAQWKEEGFVVPRRRALLVTNPTGLTLAVSPEVRCDRFGNGFVARIDGGVAR